MPKVKNQVEKKQETEYKLVKMSRPDGKSADVHPDMVQEYRKGGYEQVN